MTLLLAADWRRKEEGWPGCYGLGLKLGYIIAAFCLCLVEIGEEHGEQERSKGKLVRSHESNEKAITR